jgi:hypothetical protein
VAVVPRPTLVLAPALTATNALVLLKLPNLVIPNLVAAGEPGRPGRRVKTGSKRALSHVIV